MKMKIIIGDSQGGGYAAGISRGLGKDYEVELDWRISQVWQTQK